MTETDKTIGAAMAGSEDELEPLAGSQDPGDGSIADDVRNLAQDGKTYFEAELAFQKARAGYAAQRGKTIAIYGGLAVFFVFFALMALILGSILTLAQYFGPIAATGIISGLLLLLTALCGLVIRRNLKRIQAAFAEDAE